MLKYVLQLVSEPTNRSAGLHRSVPLWGPGRTTMLWPTLRQRSSRGSDDALPDNRRCTIRLTHSVTERKGSCLHREQSGLSEQLRVSSEHVLTLDLSSSRIQMAALGHTSTPFCFVVRQFLGFFPGQVHLSEVSFDDVHPVLPWSSWLSLVSNLSVPCVLPDELF